MLVRKIDTYNNVNKKAQKDNTNINFSQENPNRRVYRLNFGASQEKIAPFLLDFINRNKKFYNRFYNSYSNLVKIPGLSEESVIIKDIFPISYPHLLFCHTKKMIYSLSEKISDKKFLQDFNIFKNLLKKIYPDRDIIFFEHGSGNATINGIKQKTSAGKSIVFAHGHFCIMPENMHSKFTTILNKSKNILEKNGWEKLHKNIITGNNLLPDFLSAFEKIGIKSSKDYPPYLLLSEYSPLTKKERSALILQERANTNIKTPSQLYRTLISTEIEGVDNIKNWDWKHLQNLIASNGDLSDFKSKINKITIGDLDFEERLKNFFNKTKN